MRRISRPALTWFLLLCSASTAAGHDLYILPDVFFPMPGTQVRVGFHVGDAFPNSEVAGRLDRLKEPKLHWQSGEAAFENLRAAGKRNVAEVTAAQATGELIAAAYTAPTLIQLPPAKFKAYLDDEGLSDAIAWRASHGESAKPGKERYAKYAKSLLLSGGANGYATHVLGYLVEIVPEVNPYTLKAGELLPVRLVFRGKPAAGLQVKSSWAGKRGRKTLVVGRTDANGRLKVPLPQPGLWRIHAIKMERCAEPSVADWESFWASLTFELR